MAPSILTGIIGIFCVFLGIQNMKGNINSLHSYHRKRVTEDDKLAFGKQVGLGTIIIGVGIVIFSIFIYVGQKTEKEILVIIGSVIMFIGLIIGMFLSFRAMIKYNKGIF